MDINKYIEKYNPKAIFLKGSKMLGLATETSDIDIEILLDSQTLPNSYKENGIDIFFINYDFEIKSIFSSCFFPEEFPLWLSSCLASPWLSSPEFPSPVFPSPSLPLFSGS